MILRNMKLKCGFGSIAKMETCGDRLKGCIATSMVAVLLVYPYKWIITRRFENIVSNCFCYNPNLICVFQ